MSGKIKREASSAAAESMLKNAGSISGYLKKISEGKVQTLPEYLGELLNEKSLTISGIAARIGVINRSYLFRIFDTRGNENPSRETLLCIAAAMDLDIEETNRVLKLGKCSGLRAKDKRDAIIYFAILHEKNIDEINSLLSENGQPCLGEKRQK